jgi:hypothetical protein
MAAQYRALQDCYLSGAYISAGDIITFSGVPGPYLDPLTPDAVTAFYRVGPQQTVLVRPQWAGQAAVPAVTYWKPTTAFGGLTSWQLLGLGAGLPAIVT